MLAHLAAAALTLWSRPALLSSTLADAPSAPTPGSPSTPPPPPTPPTPSTTGTLTPHQQDTIAAALLGITPKALAASGYNDVDAANILAELRNRNTFSDLRNRAASGHRPSPTSPSTGAGSPNTPTTTPTASPAAIITALRAQVLAGAIPGDDPARQARLARCIDGAAIALPSHLSLACATPAQRSKLAAALVAEQRSIRLNQPLASNHASLLSTARANADVAAATQAMSDRLAAITARFAQSAP